MKGHETDDKVSVRDAAQVLKVSTKTIQRYLARGLLTRIKEGTRTYIVVSEVKGLLSRSEMKQKYNPPGYLRDKQGHPIETVTLSRGRYEEILIELGELRKQAQFLSEYKSALMEKESALRDRERDIEQLKFKLQAFESRDMEKDRELAEHIKRISELEAALDQSKTQRPWWQK